MVPAAKAFFEEVRAAYAETAAVLGLSGPTETELVLPVSAYKGGGVKYKVALESREGGVECTVSTSTDSVTLTVDIEPLAIAAGVVEKRGGVSYSAAGPPMEPGTGSWPTSSSTATPSAQSTGRSHAWTPRPCGPTSTRPGPEKGAVAGARPSDGPAAG